jgi:hypothetical protein
MCYGDQQPPQNNLMTMTKLIGLLQAAPLNSVHLTDIA